MAGEKYIQHDSAGGIKEVIATQTGGSGKENLLAILDNTGRWSNTMMPTGVGADTVNMVTSENLSSGDLVNVFDVSTVPTARKANATDGTKPVTGFVLAASTSPAEALIYMEGPITGLSGLSAGIRMYLSGATSGALTATPPTGSGNVVQFMGRAVNATTVNFEPSDPILLA